MRELFPKDIEEIADLIELFIICKNLSNTTIPQITQFSLVNWDVEDTQISSALEIIRKRQNLLGDLYPFKIDEISLKKPDEIYYEIYKVAKDKAKHMKKVALEAHLEARNIKIK